MKTKLLKLVLGNLLVLSTLLLIVELVLRLLDTGYGSSPLNPDPVFHHVHPADYRFINYSSVGDFDGREIYYDREGLVRRADEKPNQFRQSIAFLGDSFVEANQVEFDSSFIGLLQVQFPEVEMLNYGVSSYSPVLYYLVAKFKLLERPAPPSHVFIMLYSNDVEDDRTYLEKAVFDESNELTGVNGGTPNFLIGLLRRSYLFRLVRKTHITLKYAMVDRTSLNAAVVGKYLEVNPDWEETESADFTLRAVRLLESRGAKVYLTAVPSKYRHFTQDYEGNEFSHKIQKWAAQNDLRFVDLTSAFRSWREQNDALLFFENDIHFNNQGHRVIADLLRTYLVQD